MVRKALLGLVAVLLVVPLGTASAQDGGAQDGGQDGGAQDGGAQDGGEDEGDVVVEAPRQVTGTAEPTRLFNIPALAVHPDDPSTVVMAVGDSRNGGCGLWASQDGGRSWANTAENLLPEDTDHCYQRPLFPVMDPTFAPDGTLHVAMPGSANDAGHPNGPIDMLAARTDDLGATHDTVTVADGKEVTADPGDYGQDGEPAEAFTWHKAPSLVVDPTDPDRLYLGMRWNVWGTDLQGFDGDVPFRPYVAVSDDGGETWGEPIDMVANSEGEEVFGALHHDLVAAPDGTLYSFTREWPEPDSEERRLLMLTSTDQGQSWEVSVFLEDVESFRAPVAAVDPQDGTLYVVYGGEPPDAPEEGAVQEVFFTSSDDGGETWRDPVQITDADQPADSAEPNISVAPNGRVDVAWHDFRNDPFFEAGEEGPMGGAAEARYWDVYHTHSTDGGETWADNTRVTETFVDGNEGATFNNMDVRGPVGLASTNEAAYVAWSDSRATTGEGDAEDAYFSAVRFPGAAEADAAGAPSADGSAWLWGVLGAGAALAVAGVLLLVGVGGARRRAGGAPARA